MIFFDASLFWVSIWRQNKLNYRRMFGLFKEHREVRISRFLIVYLVIWGLGGNALMKKRDWKYNELIQALMKDFKIGIIDGIMCIKKL